MFWIYLGGGENKLSSFHLRSYDSCDSSKIYLGHEKAFD